MGDGRSARAGWFDDRTADETRDLVDWAWTTSFDDLPGEVVAASKRLILDHFGVALGGIDHEASLAALGVLRELGGTAQSTVLGHGDRTSVTNAALVNGISSHVLDFDDTHIATILHPTGPIMAAALAVGEWRGRSGRDLLRAHVVALEVATRVSRAIFPEHYDAGWHNSGTSGTIGAATAAALLCELAPGQLVHALGMAATQAAGHREQFGSMSKSLHVGKAGANGALAALLAARGFTAAPDSLQGRRGMFSIMSTGSRPATLRGGLGSEWEIFAVGIKPYSCGVVAHPPIDAVRQLRTERGVAPQDVASIELRVNPQVIELTGKQEPRTGLEGKFSVAFCAAIAMLDGAAGPRQFSDDVVTRPDVVALRDRIHPEADPGVGNSQAVAVARLVNGSEERVEVTAASGTPENPMSTEDLHAKFLDLAAPVLGERQADALLATAERLEELESLDELVAASVRPQPARA